MDEDFPLPLSEDILSSLVSSFPLSLPAPLAFSVVMIIQGSIGDFTSGALPSAPS